MHRVQIASNCNNRCVFCALGDGSAIGARASQSFSLAEIKLRLDALAGEPVCFIGGEPTLAPELVDLVGFASSRGSEVSIQSNARTLSDPMVAQALAEAGLHHLETALYGSTAALHDYHTAAPGSFRQTIAGVRAARAAGIRVSLTTLLTRSNYRHLAELVRLGSSLQVEKLSVRAVLPVGSALRLLNIDPPLELLRPHLKLAADAARAVGLPFHVERSSSQSFADSLQGGVAAASEIASVQKLVSRHSAAPRTGEGVGL